MVNSASRTVRWLRPSTDILGIFREPCFCGVNFILLESKSYSRHGHSHRGESLSKFLKRSIPRLGSINNWCCLRRSSGGLSETARCPQCDLAWSQRAESQASQVNSKPREYWRNRHSSSCSLTIYGNSASLINNVLQILHWVTKWRKKLHCLYNWR